jgi:hypothetical protein
MSQRQHSHVTGTSRLPHPEPICFRCIPTVGGSSATRRIRRLAC